MEPLKISIVIPTYEAKGRASLFLEELFTSIYNQTYKNIEIIVSDHSVCDTIKKLTNSWGDKLNITHFFNERGRGNSSINMNEGIKKATGDFIKIMHMDDKFCDNSAIEIMVATILENKNAKWGAFGFNHYYENENTIRREVVPTFYRNQIMDSSSLIGCPSVSFFINDKTNFFDENMIIINDFDMHYSLNKKYGNPLIISKIFITIRIHNEQVTNLLPQYTNKEIEEMTYFINKNKTI